MLEVTLIRQLQEEDISCPAGELRGDESCYCSIERLVVNGRREPSSIEGFCAGDYKECPTWQAEKQRIWDDNRVPLVDRAVFTPGEKAQRNLKRQERLERARWLLTARTEEGRRFRARVEAIESRRKQLAAIQERAAA